MDLYNAEDTAHLYDYLEVILPELNEIYKCPCNSCILSQTNTIQSMLNSILTFYKFIIRNKEFIKINEKFLKQIISLISIMLKFHKEIIDKNDIQFMNIERNVSIIYIEKPEEIYDNIIVNSQDATFQLLNIIKYYPEFAI